MFRINHTPLRDLILIDGDSKEESIFIEYLAENKFNAYYYDDNDFLTPLLLEAEIEMDPLHRQNHVIVRTATDSYQVDYYMDEDDNVTQLDYEGAPLNIRVKPRMLEKEAGEAGEMSDHVKSPMPGTVVKAFVKPGDKVVAGQPIISIESMKMEYLIKATHDATIDKVHASEGEFVN